MDFDAQPSSSSSPSSNVEGIEKVVLDNLAEMNIQEPLTLDKIEDEKNLQRDSQSESGNQNEDEDKCLIDQLLPSEMLMKILDCLDIKSLTVSRLVSRKWNGMSRAVLQSRSDVEIKVCCRKQLWNETLASWERTEIKSLENFIKCFEDSKQSPAYTSFHFEGFDPSVFGRADWIKFISYFGKSVKSLKLDDANNDGEYADGIKKIDAMGWTENLRHLLLKQLPNLQKLGLGLLHDDRFNTHPREIQLFPLTKTSTSTSNKNQENVQLANLKVLYLFDFSFQRFTEILKDLLRAAVNLQKLDSFAQNGSYSCIATFHLLHSLGKLGCLQTASINLDAKFMSKIHGKTPLGFKLKKLDLYVFAINKTEAFWWDAALFLSNLFESSKDTLTKLEMDSLGFLLNLGLPKFSKLTSLAIVNRFCVHKIQVLPPGINFVETFPVLQFLELHVPWTALFPHHEDPNDSGLPSLKTLKVTGEGVRTEEIVRISQVCPNLKELYFCDGYRKEIENFPQVGEAIWAHLTKLEALNLEIDMDDSANAFPALDSCFTGFSGEDVIRLHNLIQNEKSTEKQGSPIESKSKKQLEAERKNPSILDLKDLKKLQVHCSRPSLGRTMPGFMSVSEECAFKLMENLSYKLKTEDIFNTNLPRTSTKTPFYLV